MANSNKKCVICGKHYSYCPHCGEAKRLPSWMMIFCSDDCNTIYNTVVDWNEKKISTEEAYNKLSNINLHKVDDDDFNPQTKKQIKEILEYKKDKDVVTEVVTDESNNKEIVDDSNVDDSNEIKRPVKEFNKNKNQNNKFNNKSFYKNNK